MTPRRIAISALAFGMAVIFANAAQALTTQECRAKYNAAQADGTLKGMKWEDFRKAECGATTSGRGSATASTKPSPAPAPAFQSPWGAPVPGSGRPAY